ncbi:hypothetical protein BV25DRAFT_1823370 [Artomyces pyxidatus]|uniref:Uncharacterized protein n=1 Tax=Artomyces pyxidatus TaxID=48021 RepID=A0ACB8T8T8_9AGAM|nr:hypothetical protein BV25DRAFT_1823370 [Artomyces pyxidatus]
MSNQYPQFYQQQAAPYPPTTSAYPQQFTRPSSQQIPHDPRAYQGHHRAQSQAYPPSSYPNAHQQLYGYAPVQSQIPSSGHQLPQPPTHVVHQPQAVGSHPIPAPSPQYPPHPVSAPAGFPIQFSPTSPNATTPFRRPLPTPGVSSHPPSSHFDRSPLPTPGPTPAPASPPSRRQPPTSPSSVTSSSHPRTPAPGSPPSPSTNRRPLPNPQPRSTNAQSLDGGVRSPSPVKDAIKAFSALQGAATDGRPSSPTKFVPYWKRNLPAPNSDRATIGAAPRGWNAGAQNAQSAQSSETTLRDRSQSLNSGRPLPASPSQPPDISGVNFASASTPRALPDPTTPPAIRGGPRPRSPTKPNGHTTSPQKAPVGGSSRRAESPTKSFLTMGPLSPDPSDEDEEVSNPAEKPQYGIRDLPTRSRSIIDHNNARHARTPASIDREEEATRNRPARSATLPQPPLPPPPTQSRHRTTQSVTLRSAFSTPGASTSRAPPASTPTSPSAWPSGLPPLPRAPTSGGSQFSTASSSRYNGREREYVNLDDAPPPSLRRSPSPSASIRTAGPSKPPTFHSAQGNAAGPSRRDNASNPPSPKKFTSPLPQVPSMPPLNFSIPGLPVTSSRVPSPDRQSVRRNASPERQKRNPSPERGRQVPPPLHMKSPSPERRQPFVAPERAEPPPMAAPVPSVPMISFTDTGGSFAEQFGNEWGGPSISVSEPDAPQISINVSEPSDQGPQISMAGPSTQPQQPRRHMPGNPPPPLPRNGAEGGRPSGTVRRGGGMACGGCGGPIVGRIVSAMNARWHPGCFRCSDCDTLLEYVSSYEHEGRPYCHFDYHERFAPRCYHCKTAIVDERFITLDDVELGKRTYHEQHFFCSECGDPFLAPAIPRASGGGELTFKGDGEFEDDDVGFTVYKGYPYCEACHVRLRSPKCKKCKKNIRDGMQAVEALGGKWHYECFACTGCDKPFEDPSFFLRDKKPFCESCFSIILKSEM